MVAGRVGAGHSRRGKPRCEERNGRVRTVVTPDGTGDQQETELGGKKHWQKEVRG